MLNCTCNIFRIFFFSAAFKVNLPYCCKRHFHIHTQTNTDTQSYPFSFIYTFSFLESSSHLYSQCSLPRKSSKTEMFSTIWISMKSCCLSQLHKTSKSFELFPQKGAHKILCLFRTPGFSILSWNFMRTVSLLWFSTCTRVNKEIRREKKTKPFDNHYPVSSFSVR